MGVRAFVERQPLEDTANSSSDPDSKEIKTS